MHHSQFVLCVKNSNKEVLREFGEKVYLPFYSEYSLLLKNLRNNRAVVSVKIDGTDVLGGSQLVIGSDASIDLERFISNGDLLKGNRFKFVPVEGNAADPSSSENGIIEVKVQWEYRWNLAWPPDPFIFTGTGSNIPFVGPYFYPTPSPTTVKPYQPIPQHNFYYSTCRGQSNNNAMNISCSLSSTQNLASQATPTSKGVTVEGSRSNQAFNTTTTSWLAPEVVILKLQLLAPEQKETFTVDSTSKKYCVHCGKKLKGKDIYCSKCGKKQED